MYTLVLNTSMVQGSNNSLYQYNFPNSVSLLNHQVALISLAYYYSWVNISSSLYNNNVFQYIWTDASVNTVTIPSQFLTASDLNLYLQSVMITNTHYLIDAQGLNHFYLNIQANQSYYSIQLNEIVLPTSLPTGYSYPSGAGWTVPGTQKTPQFTILSTNNFKTLIGFASGNFPTSQAQTTNQSQLSTLTPAISPVTSVLVNCSLCQNILTNQLGTLSAFTPNVTYGSLINLSTPEFAWVDIKPGQYTSFQIQFFDQNYNQLPSLDPSLTLILGVREKPKDNLINIAR